MPSVAKPKFEREISHDLFFIILKNQTSFTSESKLNSPAPPQVKHHVFRHPG